MGSSPLHCGLSGKQAPRWSPHTGSGLAGARSFKLHGKVEREVGLGNGRNLTMEQSQWGLSRHTGKPEPGMARHGWSTLGWRGQDTEKGHILGWHCSHPCRHCSQMADIICYHPTITQNPGKIFHLEGILEFRSWTSAMGPGLVHAVEILEATKSLWDQAEWS